MAGDPEPTAATDFAPVPPTGVPRRKTFLMHIPKNAGHSLASSIGWSYPRERKLLAIGRGEQDGSVSVSDLLEMPYGQFARDFDFSYAHLTYDQLCKWSDGRLFQDFAVITLIRDPLERALSTYAYILERPQHEAYDMVRGIGSLRAFLTTPDFHPQANRAQCEWICGSTSFADATKVLPHFFAFPTVEYIPTFMREFHKGIGGELDVGNWINTSNSPALIHDLDGTMAAAFYETQIDDLQLYLWAKRNWLPHMLAGMQSPSS